MDGGEPLWEEAVPSQSGRLDTRGGPLAFALARTLRSLLSVQAPRFSVVILGGNFFGSVVVLPRAFLRQAKRCCIELLNSLALRLSVSQHAFSQSFAFASSVL